MFQYAVDNGKVNVWEPHKGRPMPIKLKKALLNPRYTIHAFNANFERNILRYVLGINLPINRFRCTMIHAYSLCFSGTMANVGQQVGLPEDKQKLKTGNKLIGKFCKYQPANQKVARWTPKTAPELWADFKAYGIQDVETERYIETHLKKNIGNSGSWIKR